MIITYNLPEHPFKESAVVALGSFDGVHLGHQGLISKAVTEAKRANGKSVVLTFDPHPLKILKPDFPLGLILSNQEKANKIASLGVDELIFLPFNLELASKTPEEFILLLRKSLNPYALIVGFDYTFGKGGSGNSKMLGSLGDKMDFQVHTFPAQIFGEIPISSTRIRQAISEGDVELAYRLLGYWPILEGSVIDGDKRGRELGFPTANVKVEDGIILPKIGVYAAQVEHEDILYPAILNVGKKPTFKDGEEIGVEVHLLDFQGDLYGEKLKIHILGYIRSELKFSNAPQLIEQIQKDIKTCWILLENANKK